VNKWKEENNGKRCKKSTNIFSDIKYFLFDKPYINTFIKINSPSIRKFYDDLIQKRIEYKVSDYNLLNIHQIGIEAPAQFVFNELIKWNSDSCWWPNHIARVNVLDSEQSKINIFLFGKLSLKRNVKTRSPGFHLLRLFNLTLIKKEGNIENKSKENIHYLLYKCSGGYPIGVFSLFTRDSDPDKNESNKSQLFMMVSFNPHGIKLLSKIKLVTKIWELIHNRVASNSLYRIKGFCEQNYQAKMN